MQAEEEESKQQEEQTKYEAELEAHKARIVLIHKALYARHIAKALDQLEGELGDGALMEYTATLKVQKIVLEQKRARLEDLQRQIAEARKRLAALQAAKVATL